MTKEKDLELEMFKEAYVIYGGMKRFVTTEFKELKKHEDWKEVLPMLKESIEKQVKWREAKLKAGEFCPEWKHMQKYLAERQFEVMYSVTPEVQNSEKPEKTPYF